MYGNISWNQIKLYNKHTPRMLWGGVAHSGEILWTISLIYFCISLCPAANVKKRENMKTTWNKGKWRILYRVYKYQCEKWKRCSSELAQAAWCACGLGWGRGVGLGVGWDNDANLCSSSSGLSAKHLEARMGCVVRRRGGILQKENRPLP